MIDDIEYFPYQFFTKFHRFEYRVRESFGQLVRSLSVSLFLVGIFFPVGMMVMHFAMDGIPDQIWDKFLVTLVFFHLLFLLISRKSIRGTLGLIVEEDLDGQKVFPSEHIADLCACLLFLIPAVTLGLLVSKSDFTLVSTIRIDITTFGQDWISSIIAHTLFYFVSMKLQDIPFKEEFFILETSTCIRCNDGADKLRKT